MGIFLGLGDAELLLARLGNGLSEGIFYDFLVEEYVHSGEACVVRGKAAVVERNGVHPLLRHIVLGEHSRQLACAVVAEVEEYDCIALFDLCERLAVLGNDYRLDEFVGHVCGIGSLDSCNCGFECLALAFNQQVVCLLYAVPSLVAVHCVEASADTGYASAGLRHFRLEVLDEALAAARVGVASVHEAVYEHASVETGILCL